MDSFANIRGLLTDNSITNLNNTGLPFGPGDFTGAFQWTVTLAPGEAFTATASMTVTYIPAPSALALLGLGGLIGCGRRRRS